jgi:hypothetical protein
MEVFMKLDKDVAEMNSSERGQELQRLRSLIRTHKRLKNNARCWLSDVALYDRALPEGSSGAGRMDLPREVLLVQCDRYIRNQQRNISFSKKSGS